MIWAQIFTQTAFIFLVMMTILANESDANIRTLWLSLTGTEDMGEINTLESDGSRLYAGTRDGLYISDDNGYTWRLTEFKLPVKVMATSP